MSKTYTAFQHPDGSYASTTDESFDKFFGECKKIKSGLSAQKSHKLVRELSAKEHRKHNPNWADNTRNQRSDKRKQELQAAAERDGFETWSEAITAWKNGNATLVRK